MVNQFGDPCLLLIFDKQVVKIGRKQCSLQVITCEMNIVHKFTETIINTGKIISNIQPCY
jgi:hypothetical protein